MTAQPPAQPIGNPYVGPYTFAEAQRRFFFGRDHEARDLTARIVAERLLLFYAQSGAGKSSLLNARVIPALRDEEGFQVLPVGRVSGELPEGVEGVGNIYVFNLISRLDQGGRPPAQLADVTLSDFLARLVRETVVGEDGGRSYRWVYKSEIAIERPAGGTPPAASGPRFVLIVDQFEELITGHPDRWEERAEFFRQLNQALADDPNLWVALTLREDYVAALDPYASLVFNRLRARFYMERMGSDAALEAVRRPAELGGRPFAPGVAEKLVEDLRQVRAPGVAGTVPGPTVEPVQLQVVCHELWEQTAGEAITEADLEKAGDVNEALGKYYDGVLAAVLAAPAVKATGLTERALRRWFDAELITENGIRNTVFRNEASGFTGALANVAVDELSRRFLLSTELRAGGAWVELAHDRLVAPVRESNATWFDANLSTLQRQAALWEAQKRPEGLLLTGGALKEAEAWAAAHGGELAEHERLFLEACVKAREDAERKRRQSRNIRIVAVVATVLAALALIAAVWGFTSQKQAQQAEAAALKAQSRAEASEKQAQGRMDQMRVLLGVDVAADAEAGGQVALLLTQFAAELAQAGKTDEATNTFARAAALDPTYTFVNVPAGEFTMGSGDADPDADDDEKPQSQVNVGEFWIMRTEVTNAQYARCVAAGTCKKPLNDRWDQPEYAAHPVTTVDWSQADAYARWAGGRLPTEAEWEKACRGTDGRIYPWKGGWDAGKANTDEGGPGDTTSVGAYSGRGGDSPYGAADMAGNVWEWTSSQYEGYGYRYAAGDGREDPEPDVARVLRGGSYIYNARYARCASRDVNLPNYRNGRLGFRVVASSP